MKLISVIIPHHFGSLIYDCLKSLPLHMEKIVVSSTPTIFPNVISKYTSHNNPSLKRNEGVKLATGDYFLFMDDDVVLEPSCVRVMSMYLELHPEVGMVFATLSRVDGSIDCAGTYLTQTGFPYEQTKQTSPYPYSVLSGKSACCMIRKQAFEEVGGFDDDFVIYGEETDLSWRLWLRGWKVQVLPFALGTHYCESPLKSKEYYNEHYIYYHGSKNYITMLIKNLALYHMPMAGICVALWLIVGVIWLVKSPKRAKWIFQGVFYNLRNLPYILKKRHKIQKERLVTDKQIFPFIYKSVGFRYYIQRLREYLFPLPQHTQSQNKSRNQAL